MDKQRRASLLLRPHVSVVRRWNTSAAVGRSAASVAMQSWNSAATDAGHRPQFDRSLSCPRTGDVFMTSSHKTTPNEKMSTCSDWQRQLGQLYSSWVQVEVQDQGIWLHVVSVVVTARPHAQEMEKRDYVHTCAVQLWPSSISGAA